MTRIPSSKIPLKHVIVLIAAVLLIFGYVIFSISNNENKDATAPVINSITGNTDAFIGETVNISVNFTDNVEVTTATIYYKPAGDNKWSSMSILSGSVSIPTPLDPVRELYYYVTVNDAAGNGPIGDPSVDGSKYYTVFIIYSRNDNQNESYPEVGIIIPEKGRINLFSSSIFKNFKELKNTFLIGKTKISVYAKDDTGIERVEFYVDGELMKTVESEPYEWILKISMFKEIFPHRHTISVKAYDITGKTATDSMDVWARL